MFIPPSHPGDHKLLMDMIEAHRMQVKYDANKRRAETRAPKASLEGVSEDLGFLALALLSLIGKLIEKGVLTREELMEYVKKADAADGAEDGATDPNQLRDELGMPLRPKPAPPK